MSAETMSTFPCLSIPFGNFDESAADDNDDERKSEYDIENSDAGNDDVDERDDSASKNKDKFGAELKG